LLGSEEEAGERAEGPGVQESERGMEGGQCKREVGDSKIKYMWWLGEVEGGISMNLGRNGKKKKGGIVIRFYLWYCTSVVLSV
jgi:hypothetical protein